MIPFYRRAAILFFILALSLIAACNNTNTYIIRTKKPLFISTSAGTEVIDVSELELVNDEFMVISSGGYVIASSKNFLYLSDSGQRTELLKIGGNQLHQLDINKGTVKTIKAPSVDDLIVYKDKVYGLHYQNGLGFIFDEEKGSLRKFRFEDFNYLIGFLGDKTLVYNTANNTKLGFLENGRIKKQLFLDGVNQAILYKYNNKNMIAAFVWSEQTGSEINLIAVPDFKIIKKLKPKPRKGDDEEAFIYNNKLYYSSTRPEGNTYFKSDYIFNVLDLSNYKIVNKVKLPALPNRVLYSKGKIYFTFFEGRKKSDMLVIVDSMISKTIKEIKIGKNVSDMILINDKLFVAAIDSKVIKVINTSKLVVQKTLRLEGEPVLFATPMPAVKSVQIGL